MTRLYNSGIIANDKKLYVRLFPSVCIRTITERPEVLDKGCFTLTWTNAKSLLQTIEVVMELEANGNRGIPMAKYVDENVSTKMVRIIQSYTGVVDRMTWRKGGTIS